MLEELFADIQGKRSKALLEKQKPYPRNNPIASDIGPCTRETALAILHWQDKPAIGERLLGRFEVGNDRERKGVARLMDYGVDVVEQQSIVEIRDPKGNLVLRGAIDGKVICELVGKRTRVPFDYKTVHPNIFPKLNTVHDFKESRFHVKWVKQVMAYCYANNIEVGFLLLDDLLGNWKFVEIPLDLDWMSEIIRQCETADESVRMIKSGAATEEEALPPYLKGNPQACRECWAFGRVCMPPISYEGLKVIEDTETEALIVELLHLKPAALRAAQITRKLNTKEGFLNDPKLPDTIVVGEILVQRKKVKKKAYQVAATEYYQKDYEVLPDVGPGSAAKVEERVIGALRTPVATEEETEA